MSRSSISQTPCSASVTPWCKTSIFGNISMLFSIQFHLGSIFWSHFVLLCAYTHFIAMLSLSYCICASCHIPFSHHMFASCAYQCFVVLMWTCISMICMHDMLLHVLCVIHASPPPCITISPSLSFFLQVPFYPPSLTFNLASIFCHHVIYLPVKFQPFYKLFWLGFKMAQVWTQLKLKLFYFL